MNNFVAFSTAKPHFKGNLHTHSSFSDGKLHPKETVKLYQQRGYHFLAFTDHEMFSWWTEFDQQDFLILPGIEASGKAPGPYQCHHIVGIGNSLVQQEHLEGFENEKYYDLAGAQAIIDYFEEQGYFTIYCHPVWSRQSFSEIADLRNFRAIEVYNHSCHIEDCTGYAPYYWDQFLRKGVRIWGVAADDSHQIYENDHGGGWVVVNAPELTVDHINLALQQGHFYFSNGPAIEAYGIKDGEVYVRCSPVASIHFITFETRGKSVHADKNGPLTEATHTLKGDEKYVRIEVVDERGRTAWSNPIFF